MPNVLWWLLLVALAVDGLTALALAGGQLYLANKLFSSLDALFGSLEAGILFAIGVVNLWAANSLRKAAPTWARDALIAQVAVLLLAFYVVVVDAFKSPENIIDAVGTNRAQFVVFLVAVTLGLCAVAWILVLIRRTAVQWTKTSAILTALLPLAGLLQFWLQTYYIPQTSNPQVDLSVDLSPQGKSGSIIHLAATVTVHNRSAAKVNVAGALMRVTGYPPTTQQQQPTAGCRYNSAYANQLWCLVEGGIDLSGANFDTDFRVNPTPAGNAHLLHASTFMGGPGAILMPGESYSFQREVDLDPGKFRLARL
jgi:hypothetical protein